MQITAVIPARGGSKSILGKNIAPLCGLPLISYAIKAAKQSNYINDVYVSTDSDAIANIALDCGALIHHRSDANAQDDSSSESVLLEVLQTIPHPQLIVFLQCTSPFTTAEDIDGTINTLLENSADTALTVAPFHRFVWTEDGCGVNHDKTVRLRRQDRSPQFVETGAVYVMKCAEFLKIKHRFFGKTVLYTVEDRKALEIDEPWDLELARIIMEKHHAS